jgi:two-component system, cell cycle sensor histidine kinase and response regulator CckA
MVRRTILVVDDEPQIRSLVKSVLSRHGHRIIEAGDGIEAMEVFEGPKTPIDLLVTDIVMPRMDGVELARRASSRWPALRVIYMSGKCEAEAVRRDIDRRGFGFLRKPFDIGELDLKVSEFLEKPAVKITVRESPVRGTPKAKQV